MLGNRKSYELLYSSNETTFKVETKNVSIQFSSVLTHSSDETNKNSPLNNIRNTSVEFDESPLQQDEAQSSKNSIANDN